MPSNRSPHFNRNRQIADLIAEERRVRPEEDTNWYRTGPGDADMPGVEEHGVDFENGWDNVGDEGDSPASWYLSKNGEVRLRGHVVGPEGTVIFTLPEEVRPQYDEKFLVAADDGFKAHVIVRANGEVFCESITP